MTANIYEAAAAFYAARDNRASDAWRDLCEHLVAQGHQVRDIVASRLAILPAGRAPFDRFRARRMTVVRDGAGKIVTFVGTSDSEPRVLRLEVL
jgi:hypothetical protein